MSERVSENKKKDYNEKAYLQVEYIAFVVFGFYVVMSYLF